MKYLDRAYELSCLAEVLVTGTPSAAAACNACSPMALPLSFERVADLCRAASSHTLNFEIIRQSFRRSGQISNSRLWSVVQVRPPAPITPPPNGDVHELDIVVLWPGLSDGHPHPDDILIGVEAKHRPYGRGLLKELLGVRREMACLAAPQPNPFVWWISAPPGQSPMVPSWPASALIGYCSYPNVIRYSARTSFFGVRLEHLP